LAVRPAPTNLALASARPLFGCKSQQWGLQGLAHSTEFKGNEGMTIEQLKAGRVLCGPIFPEPVQVIVVVPMGDGVKLIAKGLNTSRVHEPILTPENIAALETSPETEAFDGDPLRFRLAIEAMRLELAFEYDPYFSLSIARVDPLPHQLEAVYHYFMTLPRMGSGCSMSLRKQQRDCP
jgi:hypothetical protein